MKKIRKWIAYGLYIVAVAALFIYYLFPSETVKNYMAARAGQVNPDIRVSILKVTPVFPPGLRLHTVELDYQSDLLLNADEVTIVPDLMSLFSSGSSFSFRVKAHGGSIDGHTEITGNRPANRVNMTADIAGIRLENIPFVKRLSDYRLKGVCTGKIVFSGTQMSNSTMNASIEIEDMAVSLKNPVFGIKDLQFKSVNAEATLRNQQLKISRLLLKGDQFDGRFSGSGVMGNRLNNSSISLTGTITPRDKFFQGSNIKISGAGEIPVKISGTFGNLSFR